MGLNFVAIDFETAAGARDTACSVSLVRVRDCQIVDHFSTLINPECDFSPFNMRIHHITPEMVKDAPTFPEIAPVLCGFIGDDVLVAHNAPFDIDVLRKMCIRYDLEVPEYEYLCTVQAARIAFPDLINHKLNTLCEALHIPLENHHDAMCDTCACANVLIDIAQKMEASNFDDLLEKLDLDIDVIATKPVKKSHIYAQRTAEEWNVILAELAKERARKEAEKEAQRLEREKLRAQRQAEQAAKKAALLAEKEARRLEREAKRAQREAEKAAAAERITPARPVMQLTDEGIFIRTFPSMAEASRTIGIDKKGIRNTANGKQRRAAGYRWAWCESSEENGGNDNGE